MRGYCSRRSEQYRRHGRHGRHGRHAGRRVGVVLGAGGVLGAAWTVGALRALEEVRGLDPRAADVIVGTSAGSVLATLIGAGVATRTLVERLGRGGLGARSREHEPNTSATASALEPPGAFGSFDPETASGGPRPVLPRPGIGSRHLLARSVLARRPDLLAAMYAVTPPGRGSLSAVEELVEGVTAGRWVSHSACWIVAVDYDTGYRELFGRPEAPRVSMARAVSASCALPGWFAPVPIGGRRFVDGGLFSTCSLDLLAGRGLDEVIVLAPMASVADEPPATALPWLVERSWRRLINRRLSREAELLRGEGTVVTAVAPQGPDLDAIGINMMDPRRRAHVLETSLHTSARTLAESV